MTTCFLKMLWFIPWCNWVPNVLIQWSSLFESNGFVSLCITLIKNLFYGVKKKTCFLQPPKQGVCIIEIPRYWTIFTRGQFWPSGIVVACVCVCTCVCQSVCQSLACPRDNSGPVQARITKFGPKMQKTLVKVPIVLGGNWPWPSRSKVRIYPTLSLPHHNSLPIQARITKFRSEVHNSLLKILVVLDGNWPWPSRSNLT